MITLDAHFGFDTDMELWPMTVETDGETFRAVTIPVERHDGTTEDIRFVPEEENGKLRELVRQRVNEQLYTCGDCWGGLCENCDCWLSEHVDELQELGIEVDS